MDDFASLCKHVTFKHLPNKTPLPFNWKFCILNYIYEIIKGAETVRISQLGNALQVSGIHTNVTLNQGQLVNPQQQC